LASSQTAIANKIKTFSKNNCTKRCNKKNKDYCGFARVEGHF
jgi:hypothetical protein